MPENIAHDGVNRGPAAEINYSVPLPGAHSGRRIIELDLGLEDSDFLATALRRSENLAKKWNLLKKQGTKFIVNAEAAKHFFETMLQQAEAENPEAVSVESAFLTPVSEHTPTSIIEPMEEPGEMVSLDREAETFHMSDLEIGGDSLTLSMTERTVERNRVFAQFIKSLERGIVKIPVLNWAGRITLTSASSDFTSAGDSVILTPKFFVIEYYQVSSFLGDYGMGKTVKTMTLLPGETTKIRLKTWKSSKQSIKESSSIIDSAEQSARNRFTTKVQHLTTDKTTRADSMGWNVQASAQAGWGLGKSGVSVSGSAGAHGKHHTGREHFGKSLGEAVKEHAAEASSKRQLSISSSAEKSEESGLETVIERQITNVNMRRVLNFVFRELNQEYTTKIHLKDIHIAYTDGGLDSWREVSLPGLLDMLEEVLIPEKIQEIAQAILAHIGYGLDENDKMVNLLETVMLSSDGEKASVTSPAPLGADGKFEAPNGHTYYRFRRGALEQKNDKNKVDGLLLSNHNIVMRTDSVAVEALMGQSDALDDFAMTIQEAEAHSKVLENERKLKMIEILEQVPDPVQRAELAIKLFNPSMDTAPTITT